MIGRESRADFQIGDDARIERLGERNARVPGVDVARGAAGEDQDLLGAFEQRGRLAHVSAGAAVAKIGM